MNCAGPVNCARFGCSHAAEFHYRDKSYACYECSCKGFVPAEEADDEDLREDALTDTERNPRINDGL